MSSSSPHCDPTDTGNGALVPEADGAVEFNRVNCLVWVLHESARSFSLAVESLELAGSSAELATAWNGKDVHQWHKRIAHRVAVFAMLKTAIEVEILLSQERHNNPSPVRKTLTPETDLLEEFIESQLKLRHSELVQWFRVVELPRIAGFFIPLLKKWSIEYAGSGVAGLIVAISCCAAVEKLGSERTSCPLSKMSIGDALVELMNLSHSIVSVDKLHQLATEAGFEIHFLSHFGAKFLSRKESDELEFWIGLAQRKLSVAFCKETMIPGKLTFKSKVQADSLATLGLFAYLGRKTRIFLSQMRINDLDELVKDFLSYLECGSLFIFPELSSISVYQFFMEVVTDEIGWLDFYGEISSISYQDKRRSKQHTIQAEKEIILSKVFTVCYDVFSGFAHFIRSAQQPLDSELLAFLLRSQSLLTICLEDYWAAYDRIGESLKITESGASKHTPPTAAIGMTRFPVAMEAQGKSTDLITEECQIDEFGHEHMLKKDVWLGTQLLFVDIMVSLELLLKQLRGQKVTAREKRKLKRTLNDIATLIPVTILMLLPVSAVGHAAMLAAINKYIPSLIPSPYSSERLGVAKQLKRTKKMEVTSWSNLEDPTSKTS
ncbi:uncharacterized protein LOC111274552 isoform X2 [Durio zibethinus]|uniref:Uncharacterized protein LOC111274552 isoform X2 n=1 Tax=Durio zibethinus TaxID=66656 RepID=A0A6P5WGQ3_DURZI|nr:uncharacterized protein LOC111274552 isoform X2 [Durio zibethinus]